MPESEDNAQSEDNVQSENNAQSKDNAQSEVASEQDDEFPDAWMFRPCELYKEEYRDCTSIKARLHQYFIFGDTIDCSQWKTDYHNCYLWKKYKSKDAYVELANSERKRRIERLQGHYGNNTWERRENPPEDWNKPLPEWMAEKHKTTYLAHMSAKMKNGETNIVNNSSSSCTIL